MERGRRIFSLQSAPRHRVGAEAPHRSRSWDGCRTPLPPAPRPRALHPLYRRFLRLCARAPPSAFRALRSDDSLALILAIQSRAFAREIDVRLATGLGLEHRACPTGCPPPDDRRGGGRAEEGEEAVNVRSASRTVGLRSASPRALSSSFPCIFRHRPSSNASRRCLPAAPGLPALPLLGPPSFPFPRNGQMSPGIWGRVVAGACAAA